MGGRWHLSKRFGFVLTAEALIGNNWLGKTENTSEGRVSSLRAQFAPYFRPGRRVIIGPTFAFGERWYTINREGFSLSETTGNHLFTGSGIQVGWLIGRNQEFMIAGGPMFFTASDNSSSDSQDFTGEFTVSTTFAF